MEIWEVTTSTTTIKKFSTQSSCKSTSPIAAEYSKILAEKISNITADVRKMEEFQEQLDEICDLQEELTGNIKIDEDSGNANRDSAATSINQPTETIKRFMPDGSIMITTYKGAKIVEQMKQRPHMITVPDFSAPPNPDGTTATKLEARQSLDLATLLMM
ncbi:MAG: hypothetical protein IJS69_00530 [Selenomonadaceae bacterium]|nr:hypothetical protein [Selenomonadaceae bacterium]